MAAHDSFCLIPIGKPAHLTDPCLGSGGREGEVNQADQVSVFWEASASRCSLLPGMPGFDFLLDNGILVPWVFVLKSINLR
jgi:hypothetical protein